MDKHRLIVMAVLLFMVPIAWPEAKFINIILKPRDWEDPTKADGYLCGIDYGLDSGRLIAELNSNFIFEYIDKTDDITPGYRTTVFDVVVFDLNNQPHRMLDQQTCSLEEEESGLFTLFLAPGTRQCNRQTFEDASNGKEGYYPLAVLVSSNFAEVIEQFISEAQAFKPLYTEFGNKLPKLCATRMIMQNVTAHSRRNELTSIFNFAYSEERKVDATIWKMCTTTDETLNSIVKSSFFDINAELEFKYKNQNVTEDDRFAKIVILRKSSLNQKTVGFVTTEFPERGDQCKPASENDIVPLSNLVVFNEGEREGEVIVRVKEDDEIEEEECFFVNIKKATDLGNHRRRKRGRGDGGGGGGQRANLKIKPTAAEILANKLEEKWTDYTSWREKYQTWAYLLLLESVGTNKLQFDKTILKEQQKNIQNDEQKIWLVDKPDQPKSETVYEIPRQARLRNVIHEIGHLILLYGKINPEAHWKNKRARKLIRIDNFLYEIGLIKGQGESKRGYANLYIAPIACYYYNQKNSKIPSGLLSKDQCENIKNKLGPIDDFAYPTFEKSFSNKITDVFAALKKLFMAESSAEGEIDNFYLQYYGKEDTAFQAFMSETFALAVMAETVRNIEMLPVTLALIQLHNTEPGNAIFQEGKITKIHPMTADATFYTNTLHYKLKYGGWMKSVGFFPIYTTAYNYQWEFAYRIWDYNSFQQRREKLLRGTLRVHEKAMEIFQLYESKNPDKKAGNIICNFFQACNDGLVIDQGKLDTIDSLYTARDITHMIPRKEMNQRFEIIQNVQRNEIIQSVQKN